MTSAKFSEFDAENVRVWVFLKELKNIEEVSSA